MRRLNKRIFDHQNNSLVRSSSNSVASELEKYSTDPFYHPYFVKQVDVIAIMGLEWSEFYEWTHHKFLVFVQRFRRQVMREVHWVLIELGQNNQPVQQNLRDVVAMRIQVAQRMGWLMITHRQFLQARADLLKYACLTDSTLVRY